MMRKLIVPLVAAGLLAGCVTGDYTYRGGSGDYYYGRPRTEYRYHDPYGAYGAYPYGRFGMYGYYGDPYYSRHPYYGGYGYPYYGHPYYYRPPVVVRPRPDNGPAPGQDNDHDRRPPWRDLVNRRHRQINESGGNLVPMQAPERAARPMPSISRGDDGGSRMQQIMQRARQRSDTGTTELEP